MQYIQAKIIKFYMHIFNQTSSDDVWLDDGKFIQYFSYDSKYVFIVLWPGVCRDDSKYLWW